MSSICLNCVKAISLKKLIQTKGNVIKKCKTCNSKNVKALDCKNNELRQLFKALIRFYFSEVDYNTHWGGNSFERLLSMENPIISCNSNVNEDEWESAIFTLFENVYEEYDKGITLFSGYDKNGQQNMLLEAIESSSASSLNSIKSELAKKNHFLLIDKGINLICEHISKLLRNISSGCQFFRARIGYAEEGIPIVGDNYGRIRHFQPYMNADISAPPPLKAVSGRMNRDGVSFLYLANDAETAVAEVRPHPGHIVSIGQFLCKRKLKIADFNSIDIYDFYLNDEKLDVFRLLNCINVLFSIPIPPDQRQNYSITQFLSDVLRELEFDGIAYKSSVGSGCNFTFFNPDEFEYIPESGSLVRIKNVVYTFKNLQTMQEKESYFKI